MNTKGDERIYIISMCTVFYRLDGK